MGLKIPGFLFDVLFFIGAAIFSFGFWLAWKPLGFIVGGVVIALFAFFAGYRRPGSERE